MTVSDGAELEICYEAEAMPQRKVEEFLKIQVPKQIPSYYNCRLGLQRSGRSDTWIRSGNSIVFSVPQEFLTKNLKIYTLFNYEWESENGQMKADEPHHQVYFYSTDLPSGVASKVEVDVRKPSVYISFERLGGNKPLVKSQEHSTDRIFLRLHNNTALPIAIDADGEYTIDTLSPITLSDGGKGFALPDGAEVEVCYQSEAMRLRTAEEFARIQVPKQIPSYYSCSWQSQRGGRGNLWIPAGSSIVFSVPREFLGKNLKIYTLFNYEWESENGQMKADEPHHQVYFYSTDLPYELQQK